VKLRLHGTRAEVAQATRRLVQVLNVVAVRAPDPDRGASVLVRAELEVRLDAADPTSSPGAPPGGPPDPLGPAADERPRGWSR
jgi:hypothetical protein